MQRWTLSDSLGSVPRFGRGHLKAGFFLAIGALLSALPVSIQAQVSNCSNCFLGLFDEPEMLHNFGDITPFVAKDIYLGVQLASPETGVQGLEFSVSGLHAGSGILLINTQSVTTPPANVLLGSPPAPADTSDTSAQIGGMNAAWQSCNVGSQALLKLTLLTFGPISNHVLRVMHKFPPSNPTYGRSHPIMIRCDQPVFTPVRLTGLEYILGGVVAVEPQTWSGLKQLYR